MTGLKAATRKALRYLKRSVMVPHRVADILERTRRLETALQSGSPATKLEPTTMPGATPNEIYAGYSGSDLSVFAMFSHATPRPAAGFVTYFIGAQTRTSSLLDAVRTLDGQVMGRPVPHDLFEAVEWLGVLKAAASARDGRFAMMELGAGWAPWLAAGAVAARLRSIADLHLLGVEADPGRYQLMRQHFIAHRLICAAVGAEGGHARWPRIDNPANAGGARPVRETGADLDQSDADYMQSAIDSFIDVDIVPLGELLQQEPIWDLVHIDVRGWETKLCSSCIATLNTRVRRLVIGTHSRAIERGIATFMGTGCVLEHEKPTRFHFDPDKSCVEQMTDVDGLQVWRNTRLVEPFSAS